MTVVTARSERLMTVRSQRVVVSVEYGQHRTST